MTAEGQGDGEGEGGAPELSVVIPAYGGDAMLARCLEHVAAALDRRPELRAEVVVRDDASPSGLGAELVAAHPAVRFLGGELNLGFSGNTNAAVKASRGGLLCLLNTDMYVAPDFFAGCLEPFAAEPALFARCACIAEPTGNNDGVKVLRLGPEGVEQRSFPVDAPESARPAAVPYANGGGAFFRRAMFEDLGGFDEVFSPYYWEDTDLGYRAWKRGLRIVYDPALRLEHDHQSTIGREKKTRVKAIFKRNRTLFLWRNYTDMGLLSLVARTHLGPALKALLRLRLGKVAGLLAELALLPAARRSRALEAPHRRRSDAELAAIWAREGPGAEAAETGSGADQQEQGERA